MKIPQTKKKINKKWNMYTFLIDNSVYLNIILIIELKDIYFFFSNEIKIQIIAILLTEKQIMPTQKPSYSSFLSLDFQIN